MPTQEDRPILGGGGPSAAGPVLLQRILCACCGAALTTLVTTPLEVIKTRVQTTARAPGNVPHASALSMAVRLVRSEGARGLWSGLRPSLAMSVPATALYFTVYDALRDRLDAAACGSSLASLPPLVAGMTARALTATAVAPLELLRTRAMQRGAEVGAGRGEGGAAAVSMWGALRAEVAQGGVRSLWRGWAPTLMRDVPFSGIYWFGYERVKTAAAPYILVSHPRGGSSSSVTMSDVARGGAGTSSPPSFFQCWCLSFLAGFTSGAIAAALTTPFDVVKTRRQTLVASAAAAEGLVALPPQELLVRIMQAAGPEDMHPRTLRRAVIATGAAAATVDVTALGVIPASSPPNPPRGTLAIMRSIAAEQGVGGLFSGCGLRIARVGPACAIMISSYELGKLVFNTA